MKILFWNVRGLDNAGRRKQLVELVNKCSFDCICLQETFKTSFRQRELDRFAGQKEMAWSWLPCSGHSGGLLMGIDKELATVNAKEMGEFYQCCIVTMKSDGFQWTLFNIYGPAHDDRKLEFLEEIQSKVQSLDLPMVLGGDFNMIRKATEKSSGNADSHIMDAFNEMINITELRELHRSGSRYTWSNKQTLPPPILCVLDRVLVSNSWEDKFNLTTDLTAPRVGSDHNPLILDTGVSQCTQHHFFRFNAHWLHQTGFSDWVKSKWPDRYKVDPLDHWHIVSGKLRRAIKGWGQNIDSQQRRIKQDTLGKIELLDEQSATRSLMMSEWEERYSLDRDLQQILADEELQWQRRGGEKWFFL
jgi:exonuclease III